MLTLKKTGEEVFYCDKNLSGKLELPAALEEIGKDTFSGCKQFTDVAIPDTVKVIGVQAFSFCEGLMYDLTIPSGTEVGENAFDSIRIDVYQNGIKIYSGRG